MRKRPRLLLYASTLRQTMRTSTTLCLLATVANAFAADVTKFSNRTIERVRRAVLSADASDDFLQVIPLRSHTIFAPYIDQDLQNRWWDFGADAYVVRPARTASRASR